MNCDGVRELLSAYVDGELSSGELLRVEQHLRRCPVCAEEVDALRQAIAMVGALEEVELPAGFREGLRARLAKVSPQLQPVAAVTPLRPAWKRQARLWALPAAAAAAFALVTSGAYGGIGQLITRIAVKTPAVNTPHVDGPTTPRPDDTPPDIAQGGNDGPTNVEPGGGTGPGTGTDPGGQSIKPPVDVPPTPSTGEKNPEDNPEVPLGPGTTPGGTQVASLVNQVTAPEKLPRQIANRTTVQAALPEPSAACNALKVTIAGADCTIRDSGRSVEVRFSVPVDQAPEALDKVKALIGGDVAVKTEGVDRAPLLKAQHEQLITLEEDLLKLAMAIDTAKDSVQKQVESEAFARKQDEGKLAVANYNRLSAEVTTQLFVIDLQKLGQ